MQPSGSGPQGGGRETHPHSSHSLMDAKVQRVGVSLVGRSATRSRPVTRRDIELFTEISGDRNPIHYDEELAAHTRFGGIVVQGGVTTALLNAVVAEELPGPGSVFLELNLFF